MTKIKKDLRWFLFEEYQEMYKKEGTDMRSLILNYLKHYSQLYKNPLIKIGLKTFRTNYTLFSPLSKKKEKTILFQNGIGRYNSIINESSKKNAIILGIKTSALWDFISKRTMYYPVFDNVYLDLNMGIINNNEEQLQRSIDKLTEVFEYLNPDVVVLNDDALPPSRALILVSKKLGIPTVEIQHGIYQAKHMIPTGKYSDYLFVWGEYFKNIYLDEKIRDKKAIKILGFPNELRNINNTGNPPKTVYYLSEDYEHYAKDAEDSLDIKIETIHQLHALCNDLGLDFIYRPHPEEDITKLKLNLKNIKFSPKKETLITSFRKGDLFISFNSTTLIEAALHSKVCIQLRYYPYKTDDFEKLGICRSFDNLDELRIYLKKLSTTNDLSQFHQKVNKNYIEIPSPNPGTKFLDLIDEIL